MTAPQAADLPVKARPMPVAPAWAPTTSFYTFFDAVSYRSAFPGHEFRSHAYQSLTGLTYTVTPQWSVGGGMIYAWANSDLTYFGPGARSDTDQVTGFLTTAYDIPNLFTVGASGGIGKAWTDQVRLIGGLRSFAKYDADSWFASGYVSKNLRYGNLFLTPTVRLTARETNREAFTENTGIINPGEVSKAVELAYGGQIAYAIPTGRGWTFYPTAQVYGLHYFKLPLYQSDRDGLDLKLGASATVGNWSMGAAYMTILGIDSYRDYHGGRVFLTYNFGGPVSEPPRIGYGVTDDSLRLTGYTR
jgi:outer membrane autotransporter protein